jgi:peptidoglycan/LPS O-acetylase OafA/YrhL
MSVAPGATADQPRTRADGAFRPDIEGLRGLAVMLVVIFHAGLALPGGFIGVDVFFVISGFLITGLLLRERERTGRINLLAFYARRVRRLLPAAVVVIAVALPIAYSLYAPLDRSEVLLDGAASALSIGNVRFAMAAGDYFHAITTPSPFLHFWSLGVEEQFYLVWPGLLLLAAGGFAAARAIRLSVGAVLVLVFAVSLVASIVLTEVAPNWAFYSLPTRAFELAAGGLLAVGAGLVARLPGLLITPLGWLGLAAIVWSSFAFDAGMAFPGDAALVPTLATVALMAAGGRRFAPAAMLSVAPIRFLGRISYSLYLWHWPILILSGLALGFSQPGLVMGALLIGLSIVVSAVSWAFIEEPFRRGLPGFVARPGRTVFAGVSAILAVAIAANGMAFASNRALSDAAAGISAPISAARPVDYVAVDPMIDEELPDEGEEVDFELPEILLPDVILPDPTATPRPTGRPSAGLADPGVEDPPRTPKAVKPKPAATVAPTPAPTRKPKPAATPAPQPAATPAPKPAATPPPKPPGPAPTMVAATPKPQEPPTNFALSPNVQPALVSARNDKERIWFERCVGNVEHTAPRPGCVYGNKGGSYTIALVGDSHASHFFPAFERVAQQNGWRLLVMVKVSCTFTDMRVRNILLKREYTECASWNEGVVSRINAERPNLTVIINNRSIFPLDPAQDTYAAKAAGVARMIGRLPGKVVLMADSPRSAYDVPACLSSNLHDIRNCATGRKRAFGYHGVIEKKVAEQARVPLIDIAGRICADNPCPAVVDNMIVYRDSHHLTATFARSLGPDLERLLNKVR